MYQALIKISNNVWHVERTVYEWQLLLLMGAFVVVSGWLCEVMSAGTACEFGSDWPNILAPPLSKPVTICSFFESLALIWIRNCVLGVRAKVASE